MAVVRERTERPGGNEFRGGGNGFRFRGITGFILFGLGGEMGSFGICRFRDRSATPGALWLAVGPTAGRPSNPRDSTEMGSSLEPGGAKRWEKRDLYFRIGGENASMKKRTPIRSRRWSPWRSGAWRRSVSAAFAG